MYVCCKETTTHGEKKNLFQYPVCWIEGGGLEKIQLLLSNVGWSAASAVDSRLFPLPVIEAGGQCRVQSSLLVEGW